MPENTTVKSIRDNRTWQEALGEKRAFVYKHSPICHLSSMAHREVIKFVTSNSQIPIYMVDVLSNRDMSDRIENDLGILHESPQMILLADGIPKWSDSHLSIKADAMTVELSKLG